MRARLALQLLRIADAMTKSQIRIYLTDPSADNFAVDREGTVRIIDVENVVLVDSQQKGIGNGMLGSVWFTIIGGMFCSGSGFANSCC